MDGAASRIDGRVERGERTRRQILDAAVDVASVEGLEGLSIGVLASKLRMSKSGLFAAFGSKEDLQLATIDHAASIFVEQVVRRGLSAPRGLPRLTALCDAWLDYARREVFRGGCFFAAASAEFDGRPGPVRDRVKAQMKDWMNLLMGAVRRAQQEGHLRGDAEPAQLAFELYSIAMGTNWSFQLFGDAAVFRRARDAMDARLVPLATGKAPLRGPSRRREAPTESRRS
jgi:AcrR family transcriptional regulator